MLKLMRREELKNYNKIIIALICMFVCLTFSDNISAKVFLDYDKLEDKFSFSPNQDDGLRVCITLAKDQNERCFNLYTNFESNESNVYSHSIGEIVLQGACCGREKDIERYFYRYISKIDDWILYKEINSSYIGPVFNYDEKTINFDESKTKIKLHTGNESISGKKYDAAFINPLEEKRKIRKNLVTLHDNQLRKFRRKKEIDIKLDLLEIFEYLSFFPLDAKNVEEYNNIAYFLSKNKQPWPALYLLDKITKQIPNRVTAHLNIADIYYEKSGIRLARKSYETYVSLMRTLGKASKVPKKVMLRLKEKD